MAVAVGVAAPPSATAPAPPRGGAVASATALTPFYQTKLDDLEHTI
jgi:hypothetical protein